MILWEKFNCRKILEPAVNFMQRAYYGKGTIVVWFVRSIWNTIFFFMRFITHQKVKPIYFFSLQVNHFYESYTRPKPENSILSQPETQNERKLIHILTPWLPVLISPKVCIPGSVRPAAYSYRYVLAVKTLKCNLEK